MKTKKSKYLKYKSKYLYLKCKQQSQHGEGSLPEMPQLCLGTSNWTTKCELKNIIKKAITIGYRHFDGALSLLR